MILVLNPEEHETLLTIRAHNTDAKLLKRVQIVLALAAAVGPMEVARRVGCDRSTVYRVGQRFADQGVAGIEDGRARLRGSRATTGFMAELGQLVDTSPREHGWARGTWSLELFVLELARRDGGKRVHPSTIARYLAFQRVAFNRARPVLVSPDPDKAAKLAAIEAVKANLAPGELLFYADEVDIHLNPKIGPQWSRKGQQPLVVTPGNNRKNYIAGALDHRNGELVYLAGTRKNSDLFIGLVQGLSDFYSEAPVIHVVVDNYIIHKHTLSVNSYA